jgi:hypothetical protein
VHVKNIIGMTWALAFPDEGRISSLVDGWLSVAIGAGQSLSLQIQFLYSLEKSSASKIRTVLLYIFGKEVVLKGRK